MEKSIRFSILIVALNPEEDLIVTLDSIRKQSYSNYEVVIKDGLSHEKSNKIRDFYLEKQVEFSKQVTLVVKEDESIYDAMNQAVVEASGDYLLFLNCGDSFYNCDVLKNVAKYMEENKDKNFFYGDVYHSLSGDVATANPNFTPFASYRNMPCHQTCFYHKSLLEDHPYQIKYQVRADYEHFLWAVFSKDVSLKYMPIVVASYQGGGFSETKENRKKAKKEHKIITQRYFTIIQRIKYRVFLYITLAPIRRIIAENKYFSKGYQKMVKGMYRNR